MKLVDCIDRIPTCLSSILSVYENPETLCEELFEQCYKKMHIIGSGTSYNAGLVAQYFLTEQACIPCDVFLPNELKHNFNDYNFSADDLFIFVSQGGSTKLVYENLLLAKQKGYTTLALTENMDGPIAISADYCIDMYTGHEEFIYRTIGYSCTSLILCMLGLNLSYSDKAHIQPYFADAHAVISNLDRIKRLASDWFELNGARFLANSKFVVIGDGILYPLSKEINLKFLEMIPKVSSSYELEEVIHGPQNSFDNDTCFFILSSGQDTDKVGKISKFIATEISNNVVIIGPSTTPSVELNCCDKFFYFLEVACFAQYIAYWFAELNKRDLTQPIYSNINSYISKTL